jgi:hypothetical protein
MMAEQNRVGLMKAFFDFGGPGGVADIGLQHGTPQHIENPGADSDGCQRFDFHSRPFSPQFGPLNLFVNPAQSEVLRPLPGSFIKYELFR